MVRSHDTGDRALPMVVVLHLQRDPFKKYYTFLLSTPLVVLLLQCDVNVDISRNIRLLAEQGKLGGS